MSTLNNENIMSAIVNGGAELCIDPSFFVIIVFFPSIKMEPKMTPDTRHGQQENNHSMPSFQTMPYPDDEIDLREVFATLWRRRKFIGFGVLLFVVAAVAIVFTMPDVYRVKALVSPGIVSREPGGEIKFTKSLEHFKGQIDAGVYNSKLDRLLGDQFKDLSFSSKQLRASIPKNSSALLLTYDTTNQDFGKAVLSHLVSLLKKGDAAILNSYEEGLQSGIELNKNALAESEQQIDHYDKYINELMAAKKDVQQQVLIAQKSAEKYSADGVRSLASSEISEDKLYTALLYNNMVVQNRQALFDLNNEISKINTQIELIESKKQSMSKLYYQLLKDIDESSRAIKNIRPFQAIIPVMAEEGLVGPKRKLIVVMSFVCGLFFMIFAGFFIEFIKPSEK